MGHYLIEYDDGLIEIRNEMVVGPITAINPEEAVKQTDLPKSHNDITFVWSVKDDGEGSPEQYRKEDLDL